MNKEILKEVVLDQYNMWLKQQKNYINRMVYENIKSNYGNNFIVILSWMRRVWKSSLFEIIKKDFTKYYYLNFDDERLLGFNVEDFSVLYDIFLELFWEWWIFLFDEIQNITAWEKFVRRLHNEQKKVFITGSNANLLSKELWTHLTWRYVQFEVFPFSFSEFLDYKNIVLSPNDFYIKEKRSIIKNSFEEYLKIWWLPEYISSNQLQYLKNIYDAIIYKDIIARYNLIWNQNILKDLLKYLYSNISSEFSYNKLKGMLWLSNSITVKEYINYFENSYLLFAINKFDYSLKKQLLNPKKIYSIDSWFSSSVSFEFSQNNWQKLENLVFIELKRRWYEIFYHRAKKECDFLLRDRWTITWAIQVSWSLYETETKKRELDWLLEALKMYDLQEWIILTNDEEETLEIESKTIKIIPVWKWML